jgi:hypothetical protein
MPWGPTWLATLEGGIRWHPERGQAVVERAWQVPECDFRPTVKSESSDTLYEATNREKLKQETASQIPKSKQGIRKTSSPVMAMYLA